MTATKENYQVIYQNGLNKGFSVIDARQYYANKGELLPELEQMIMTPWFINQNQVYGYVVTDIDSVGERRCGYRKTLAHEFWIFDARKGNPVNLNQLYPQGCQLSNRQGQIFPLNDAFAFLDEFAAAASYLPHVFMAPEFIEARNYLHGRMGLQPVNANDYINYLRHMEMQLQNGDLIFVGKITNISDMQIAYDSLEGIENYEKISQEEMADL